MHTKGPTKATRFIKTPAGGAAQVISFFLREKGVPRSSPRLFELAGRHSSSNPSV